MQDIPHSDSLVDRDIALQISHGNLSPHTWPQILTIETPGTSYFMTGKLARPHEAVKSRAAYPQIAHCFFER